MSYLEYYNERKDKTDELFFDSVAVSGPEERDRIEDPTVARIPAQDTVWALQGLPPFGTILSRYDYRSDGESFLFLGTNHDTLTFRSVPVVRQGNMVTAILVVPGDDFILMYGVGAVRAFTMFGLLDDRIEAAFSGRTEGVVRLVLSDVPREAGRAKPTPVAARRRLTYSQRGGATPHRPHRHVVRHAAPSRIASAFAG